MKRMAAWMVTSLLLAPAMACDKDQGSAVDTTRTTGGTVPATPRAAPQDNPNGLTPMDQGNRSDDLQTTQEIRKALIEDDALSYDAKNVKVMTVDGIVTLRGAVRNDSERATVELMARKAATSDRVVNELEIEPN